MKATFKRWVIGKANPKSGKVDRFVDNAETVYTGSLDDSALFSTEEDATKSIAYACGKGEVVLEATVTVEVKV